MANRSQKIQARLDSGGPVEIDEYGLELDFPLYITKEGTHFVGKGPSPSPVECNRSGTGTYIGCPRTGLINHGHFPSSGGFRTCGDAHAQVNGTEIDLGPGNIGWPNVTRLELKIVATMHPPYKWEGKAICGMSSDEWWANTDMPRAGPWCLYCGWGVGFIRVKTTNPSIQDDLGKIHTFSFPLNTDDPKLGGGVVTIVIEPSVPRVRAITAAGEQIVTLIGDNTDWVSGRVLGNNDDGWSFCVGWLDPFMMTDRGYPLDRIKYDATFHHYNFLCSLKSGGNWTATSDFVPALRGANNSIEYPLIATKVRNGVGTKWLNVIHHSQQGETNDRDNVEDVVIRNLEFLGASGNPIWLLGRVQGNRALNAERVRFLGGWTAVDCLGVSTLYNHQYEDCDFASQEIRAGRYVWGSDIQLDNSPIQGGMREFFRFLGCGGLVNGPYYTPPQPGAKRVFTVVGGDMVFRRPKINYESQPYIPPTVQYRYASLMQAASHGSTLEVDSPTPGGQIGHNNPYLVVVESLEPPQHTPPPIPSISVRSGDYRISQKAVHFNRPQDKSGCKVLVNGSDLLTPIPGGS